MSGAIWIYTFAIMTFNRLTGCKKAFSPEEDRDRPPTSSCRSRRTFRRAEWLVMPCASKRSWRHVSVVAISEVGNKFSRLTAKRYTLRRKYLTKPSFLGRHYHLFEEYLQSRKDTQKAKGSKKIVLRLHRKKIQFIKSLLFQQSKWMALSLREPSYTCTLSD
ncbi:hypothetical protein KIN20_028545 [Parelaphostrongylus tenuis]|uniref:Uncharacterized protein n=1 Tax=Parelaphostrongylus tenuis TaxID=148309 RepID=A0AAD5R1S1_PARTN|nr:hypothetical protein KIN20_028545 [Parelaphostrongylus tenuis]